MYTHIYANDALRRKTRLENKKIKNVDIGLHKVDLHSEASFSPSWPEIIWFACILPSQKNSGNTILCDGIKLWEAYPKTINPITLNHAPNGEIVKIPVSFAYRYWTKLGTPRFDYLTEVQKYDNELLGPADF